MRYTLSGEYMKYKDTLANYVENYEIHGKSYGNQKRNSLRLFDLKGDIINIKSFKVPHFFNRVVYRFFRKSKAQRSFEHAHRLISLGLKTPYPIGYCECRNNLSLSKSFFISQHLSYDMTFRDLKNDKTIPDRENILRAFTRFTYQLHENNVFFLDHSPGNTLIKKRDKGYDFYLVDLNRMVFKALNFEQRINNFVRLMADRELIQVMSDEYAKCLGEDRDKVFEMMWSLTRRFQKNRLKKEKYKRLLKRDVLKRRDD